LLSPIERGGLEAKGEAVERGALPLAVAPVEALETRVEVLLVALATVELACELFFLEQPGARRARPARARPRVRVRVTFIVSSSAGARPSFALSPFAPGLPMGLPALARG